MYNFLIRSKKSTCTSQDDRPNNGKWTQSSKWEAAPGVPDEANKHCLMYLTCLCQLDVILAIN